MQVATLNRVLAHLRKQLGTEAFTDLSDADLLERFCGRREEAAFALLLQRHGPTVLGVCLRVLGDVHAAEDAFQATFLVLVRKAGCVRKRQSLGSFLYGVAYRTASRVRAQAAERRNREQAAVTSPSHPDALDAVSRAETCAILHEELVHLPDKYRRPLVLCYLEGKTHEQAAREMSWPKSSVAARLKRGCELLRQRLSRRGVAPTLGVLAVLLADQAAQAVPAILTLTTVRRASQALAGGPNLAGDVLKAVAATRWGALLALLTVGLVAAGVGVLAAQQREPQTDPPGERSVEQPKAGTVAATRFDQYGDPLPPGALVRMGTVRYAQGDSKYEYPVFSPDQKTFATVSNYTPYGQGRVVCLWDATTGKELWHIDDPDVEYFRVFFLKGANLVGTLGSPRKQVPEQKHGYVVRYWDAATGQKAPADLQCPDDPLAAWSGISALSPDEKWLATVWQEPQVVGVRDRKTGKLVAEWKRDGDHVSCLAFAPDGKTLAICDRKAIYFWDWQSDRKACRIGDLSEDVQRLQFSADGRLAAGTIYTEGLRVWETKGWTEVQRIKGVRYDIRFLPGSERLLSLNTGVIWDVASGKEVGQFEGGADCQALDFSADGRSATGYAHGRVRRWDADTGKDRSTPALTAPRVMVHQVGFLPDGKGVVAASPDGAVRLWDATTGRELRTLVRGTVWDDQPTFLRVAPDGTVVVARGNRLSFFKGEAKPEEVKLTEVPAEGLASLNLSPDGKTLILATGGQAKRRVEIWNLGTRKKVLTFVPREGTSLETLGVSSDRQVAAAVGRTVSLLNLSGEVTQTLDERPAAPPTDMGRGGREEGYSFFPGVQALTFAPDGDVLASAGHPGGGLKLLDVFAGKPRHVLVPPAKENQHYELRNAIFSPNGRMIAAESESGVVDVWETSSGEPRRRFLGHRSYQTTLAFSPDGARLATGNRDATVLVWDIFGAATDKPPGGARLTEAELLVLWERLLDKDAERACRAMGRLMQRPDDGGPFLRRRLLDRKCPEVAQLRSWIADLDDDQFDKRNSASLELAKRLPAAEPLLKESLADNPSPEARRRLESLVSRLEPKPLPADTIRDLRALEVLEYLGPEAMGELPRELTKGVYDPRVVSAAQAANKRLKARGP